jgi:gentisate 1,2-dioxygenase
MRQPKGGRIDAPKTTVNNLYAVIGGQARVTVDGGLSETLGPGDVIAVPCWHGHRLEVLDETTFLRVSDEALLAKAGLARSAN